MDFRANSAWFPIAILAHNTMRWTAPFRGSRHRPHVRCLHEPRPNPCATGPSRQPRRSTHSAVAIALALGEHGHHDPRRTPFDRARLNLTASGRQARRRTDPPPPARPTETGFKRARCRPDRPTEQLRRHRLPPDAHRSRVGGSRVRSTPSSRSAAQLWHCPPGSQTARHSNHLPTPESRSENRATRRQAVTGPLDREVGKGRE